MKHLTLSLCAVAIGFASLTGCQQAAESPSPQAKNAGIDPLNPSPNYHGHLILTPLNAGGFKAKCEGETSNCYMEIVITAPRNGVDPNGAIALDGLRSAASNGRAAVGEFFSNSHNVQILMPYLLKPGYEDDLAFLASGYAFASEITIYNGISYFGFADTEAGAASAPSIVARFEVGDVDPKLDDK